MYGSGIIVESASDAKRWMVAAMTTYDNKFS